VKETLPDVAFAIGFVVSLQPARRERAAITAIRL
jgi:hypothetical protein